MTNAATLISIKQQQIKKKIQQERVKWLLSYGPVGTDLLTNIKFHIDLSEDEGYYLTVPIGNQVGRIKLYRHEYMDLYLQRFHSNPKNSSSKIITPTDAIPIGSYTQIDDPIQYAHLISDIYTHHVDPYLNYVRVKKIKSNFLEDLNTPPSKSKIQK